MDKMFTSIQKIILILLILFSLAINTGAENFTQILPPEKEYNPHDLLFVPDPSGNLNLLYKNDYENGPGKICYLKSNGSCWLPPGLIESPAGNEAILHGAKPLSNGSILLLFSGDNTDYGKLFNINESGVHSTADIEAYLNVMPAEELLQVFRQNQRLFYALQTEGVFSKAIPVPETFGVTNAILETGSSNSAIAVFFHDEYNNVQALVKRELYYCIFNGITWAKPRALTSNSLNEYAMDITALQDRFLVTWVIDNDNSSSTLNDASIQYAAIDLYGQVMTGPASITADAQENPLPVLGAINNQGILVWTSGEMNEKTGQKVVWQALYDDGWTEPTDTGFTANRISDGEICSADPGAAFLFRNGNNLICAYYDGACWGNPGVLVNLNAEAINASEISYRLDAQKKLHIAAAGYVPDKTNGGPGDPLQENEYNGIYYSSITLLPDLQVTQAEVLPKRKHVGENGICSLQITNTGFMPSNAFSSELSVNGEILKQDLPQGLLPGESTPVKHDFTIDKPSMVLPHTITTTSIEIDAENNKLDIPLIILPDYAVRSVKRNDGDIIEARIIEKKKIAASSVAIDFYLSVNNETEKVGSSVYDPIQDNPVSITCPELSGIQSDFQITVEVNHDRSVKEDEYTNNKGSYIFHPLPDFTIENLNTTGNQITLTIRNIGAAVPLNTQVDFLITGSPQEAAFLSDAGGSLIHIEGNAIFRTTDKIDITLSHDQLTTIPDKKLYAIINPLKTIEESNYNNNSDAIVSFLNNLPPAGTDCDLRLGKVYSNGTDIIAPVINLKSVIAIAPEVQLLKNNSLISNKVFTVIKGFGSGTAVFKNMPSGLYTIKLIYKLKNNQFKVIETTLSK